MSDIARYMDSAGFTDIKIHELLLPVSVQNENGVVYRKEAGGMQRLMILENLRDMETEAWRANANISWQGAELLRASVREEVMGFLSWGVVDVVLPM